MPHGPVRTGAEKGHRALRSPDTSLCSSALKCRACRVLAKPLRCSLVVCVALITVGACSSSHNSIRCPGEGARDFAPVSPAGRIAWWTDAGSGPCFGIYTMDGDGGNIRAVTTVRSPSWPASQLTSSIDPSWSPDGRLISFASECGNSDRVDVCVMNADGTNVRTVATGTGHAGAATWSPDGSRLAFTRILEEPRRASIRIIGIDGAGETTLVDDAMDPSWSPDGAQIAFSSIHEDKNEIYVVNVDGSGLLRLTEGPTDRHAAWSPDGDRIAFSSASSGKDEFVTDDARRDPTRENLKLPPRPARDIFVMASDGTDVHRLTSDPSNNDSPAWSPDGDRLVFDSNRDGDYDIYVMTLDGAGLRKLTDFAGSDGSPSWTRAG
jgi:Tol biopolymer transport system component